MKHIALIFTSLFIISVLAGCGTIPEESQNSGLVVYTKAPEEILTEPELITETEVVTEEITETITEEIPETEPEIIEETFADYDNENYVEYHFRNKKLLNQHFQKHGGEFAYDFGYQSAEEYEKGASDVINNPVSLYKTEAEDGDGIYYIESTNEFVVLSTDGYIRTYFRPDKGIDYFNRQ
ncbi:MAG: hypothetical protein IJM19_04550 [Ruminococcus sp.]|nr:hypothetical protein [Ruminococcus sp.]